jgi:cation transport ATPase
MSSTPALRTAGRVAGSLAIAGLGLVTAAIWVFVGGFSCDESCTLLTGEGTRPGIPWRDAADSWQWTAITCLGLATLVLALACAVTLHMPAARRRRVPAALGGLAAVCGVIPWLMLH